MPVVSDPGWTFERPWVVQNIQWIADLQRSREWRPRARQEWVLVFSQCPLRQPRKVKRQEKNEIDKVTKFGVPHEVIE